MNHSSVATALLVNSVAVSASLLSAVIARADVIDCSTLTLGSGTDLTLQPAQSAAGSSGPASSAAASTVKPEDVRLQPATLEFGKKGWTGWTIAASGGGGTKGSGDFALQGMLSTFVSDGLEVGGEIAGWYFNQKKDTGGVSFNIDLRYHFWFSDDRAWSVFAEGRLGVLGSFDDVPDGGTRVNFTPGLGAGFTRAIGEQGARLVGGLRWHHISNARINGDSDNPSRNGVQGYIGITWPF